MITTIFSLHSRDGKMEVEVGDATCMYPVWDAIMTLTGKPDDAGCDWVTDFNGNTYIAYSIHKHISNDPLVAALVDTANYIALGRILKMEPDDYAEPPTVGWEVI